ncbi:uncharacterized protein [Lepeophtheirus salmonis]|uniref:Uncharacterized protein n=1 Tax=Lepeophtheirus salmonis TaxID=72036 RepID=A0A0K2T2S9_LEPSM|nr:uncharacterized protein LOC121119916 [Lepeophtheirus salmonis]
MFINALITVTLLVINHQVSSQSFNEDFLKRFQNVNINTNTRRSSGENLEGLTRNTFVDSNRLPGKLKPDGTYCINKVVEVEETEFERGMECHHTFNKKCHITYITDYSSSAEKKCDTDFRKKCRITFKAVPHNEKVKVCHTPLVRKCDDENKGPEVCTTEYENHCETKYKVYELDQDEPNCKMVEELRCMNVTVELFHIETSNTSPPFVVKEKCERWPVQKCELGTKVVTKVHPETSCNKIPKEVCAPSNCKTAPGKEICKEETRTLVQNVPEEDCDLQPQESCRMQSSLVPRLVPKQNCIKVPKEVCVNTKKNPKKIKKPIMKEWCYNPDDLLKEYDESKK